jgi:putative membrane protein
MKKLSVIPFALLLVWTVQSCNSNTSNKQPDDSVDSAKEVNETAAPVDQESSDFAVKAASGGAMEVELGNAAQQKAGNQRVKDFGSMMVRDHSKANEELKTLASNKNIVLPGALGEDHQKHVDELNKRSGADFDKEYIDMMVKDHQEDISEFEKAASSLKDPDLKSFAANTLPVLKAHLDSAKAVQDELKKKKKAQ